MLQSITGAPIWVWPLLALLVWLGLSATRERERRVGGYWALPFFVFLSLSGMSQSPEPAVAWPLFAAAYLGGAIWGREYQGGVILERRPGVVRVRGEWVTFATMMAIFWLSYLKGALSATAPEVLGGHFAVGAFALLSGGLAGQFAGRAFRVLAAPKSAG